MQTFSTICRRKWQPSVDLTGTVSRLTQYFIGITASDLASLRPKLHHCVQNCLTTTVNSKVLTFAIEMPAKEKAGSQQSAVVG